VSRKAVIVISLIEESVEKSSEEIENEIFQELSKGNVRIPWCKNIENVRVTRSLDLG
jgi:hypothetical protein